MQFVGEVVSPLGGVDLLANVAALQEQPPHPWPEPRRGKPEEPRQWGKRPRGDDLGLEACSCPAQLFNAHAVDLRRRRCGASDLGKERALLGGAFHQMHAEISVIRLKNGNDKTRKSRACPQVEPGVGIGREPQNLCRIGEMAVPDVRKGRGGYEVLARLPFVEDLGVTYQPVDCFTWNFKGFCELFSAGDGI